MAIADEAKKIFPCHSPCAVCVVGSATEMQDMQLSPLSALLRSVLTKGFHEILSLLLACDKLHVSEVAKPFKEDSCKCIASNKDFPMLLREFTFSQCKLKLQFLQLQSARVARHLVNRFIAV